MDAKLIDVVGKLVNRATSDNREEAEAAARGAVGRLRKAGHSFEDYLDAFDPDSVFQAGVVRTADWYVASRIDLSEPSKRDLYSRTIRKISGKYSPQQDSGAAGRGTSDARDEPKCSSGTNAGTEGNGPSGSGKKDAGRPSHGDRGKGRWLEFFLSPARRFFAHPAFGVWRSDPAGALRACWTGLVFGAMPAVAATIASAFAFAFFGGMPDGLGEIPTVSVLAALWILFGAGRVWAGFHPALRGIFR